MRKIKIHEVRSKIKEIDDLGISGQGEITLIKTVMSVSGTKAPWNGTGTTALTEKGRKLFPSLKLPTILRVAAGKILPH